MIGLGLAIPTVAVNQRLGAEAPASLPLDEVSGAVAAYSSERQLRDLFSGNALRVRRSSDNLEQDIPFVNGSLDTATLLSFCGAGDGFIVTQYDQKSGTANDVSQATAANQPKIVSSGSLVAVDGFAATTYDGTNDRLVSASNTGITGTQQRAMVAVVQRAAGSASNVEVIAAIGTGEGSDGERYSFTSEYGIRVLGGFEVYTTSVPSALELVTLVFPDGGSASTDHKLYINGAEQTASSTNSQTMNTVNSLLSLGQDNSTSLDNYDGELLEFYLFNQDLSGGDRATLEANIAAYYGITLS